LTLTNGGSFTDKVNFIWSVADLLRGTYKQSEYGRVILPLVVIRRLDCVLEGTKPAVLARAEQLAGRIDNPNDALCAAAGHEFYNLAPIDFAKLTADPEHVADNLRAYIGGFSSSAREVVDKFRFEEQIKRLDESGLLYPRSLPVRRHRPAHTGRRQHRDGLHLRGVDPALLGAVERDRRRGLHAP
jgi:type I restriction enzyme M protein